MTDDQLRVRVTEIIEVMPLESKANATDLAIKLRDELKPEDEARFNRINREVIAKFNLTD